MSTITIIVPTLNGENELKQLFQLLPSREEIEVIVIDSSSSDNTRQIASSYGARVLQINRKEFNHGKTRNIGVKEAKGEIVIFLTQDALLFETESIEKLLEAFRDEDVSVSFGRQVPHLNAKFFGSFARMFNYPVESSVRSYRDKTKYGLKTVFNSNSFAAYRKDVLVDVGGFPDNVILGEDMYVAAKMVMRGKKIAYTADAIVYHSHDFTIMQEFQRNFDIGVFHTYESWLLKEFSNPEGEGVRFVLAEWKQLIKQRKLFLLPISVLRNSAKYIGYKMGRNYKILPPFLRKKISMYKAFWNYN